MQIREEKILRVNIPNGFCPKDTVFFDIETTGLGWRSSHIYLIGVLFRDTNGWILRQWFLDRPFLEKELLVDFSRFLQEKGACSLCHYNGDTFDLPYLRNKYGFYELPVPEQLLPGSGSIDIFRMVRPLKNRLPVPTLKQQELESFLSTGRIDHSSGGDLVEVYHSWLLTGDDGYLETLFRHNHDDVLGLPGVLPVLSFRDFWNGDFTAVSWKDDEDSLRITLRPVSGFPASFHLCSSSGPVYPEREDNGISVMFGTDQAEYVIPVSAGERKLFFPDHRSYYYLPEEDRAVHRSVGRYVDPAHRIPATPSNCYERVTDRYLPAPHSKITDDIPVFYRSREERGAWIRVKDLMAGDAGAVGRYAASSLKEWF